jgi:hypothetical protein
LFFNALISGLVGLDRNRRDANREMWYTKLGIELLLSFWLAFVVAWGAFTLAALGFSDALKVFGITLVLPFTTKDPILALVIGFACGLLAGGGAMAARWTNSPLSKGLGLQKTMMVALAEQRVEEAGVSVQKN